MRNAIKQIIVEEFNTILTRIEQDFHKNYTQKVNNFLLCQMDNSTKANMVFVSSFESKSGGAIQRSAKRIAQLTYGRENVPSIVNPRNLHHNFTPDDNNQFVVTDVETTNGDLQGAITTFRVTNEAYGRGRNRVESRVTHETCRTQLLPLSERYRTAQLYKKPVDLAFFDGENWNIMELKAGGNLDSSNAPSNIGKLLTIYVDMGIPNCNAYFATLYNKDGEGNTWTGGAKKYLHYPSMFLIGSDFWNLILPEGITFNDFTEIYREALEEIDLNSRINTMIRNCIGG